MSTPFLAQLAIYSFNFAPKGWALANGQLLPINQNQALFSLLGTTYGGNGQTTFGLPNLRGQVPIHMGSGFTLGETAGTTAVTITAQTMPQHVHTLQASTATSNNGTLPTNAFPGNGSNYLYSAPANLVSCGPTSVSAIGGSQAHENMMPYLTLNFCIALQGIFPSQN